MSLRHAAKGAERAQHIRRYMKRTGRTPWGKKIWAEKEDDNIIKFYPDIKMLRRRLKSRSIAAIRQRAGALGVRRKIHIWKAPELAKLRKLCATASWRDILAAFPDLTKAQIKSCIKYRGIKCIRRRFCKTGIEIIDVVREKAYQMNFTMPDLDYMAGSKNYFSHALWHNKSRRINKKAIWDAIEALGGKISVQWE